MRHTLLVTPLLLAACFSDESADPEAPVAATTPSAPAATTPTTGNPPVTGLHLQSLVATSGGGVATVLDGDPATGWRPEGGAHDEGILLRFEEPTRVLQASLQLCQDSAPATFQSFVDGSENTLTRIHPGGPVLLPWRGGVEAPSLRSLYVRALSADGELCIAEITLVLPPEQQAQVKAPRALPGTVQATSVLEPADAYHPGYLFDGRTDFGWVEGAAELGVGEQLTIQLERPASFEALDLWNGYQRSEDHFRKNGRLASLKLTVDDSEPVTLPVADTMGAQTLALPAPVTGQRLTLEIAQATPGSKYQDLVLSELRLRDADGPIAMTTPDLAQRKEALQELVLGKDLAKVVDRSWKSVCGETTRLKLRSNHSFVVYMEGEEGPDDSASEVFDGAWVVRKQSATETTVQLYGRRHRTETTWVPYGDDQVASSVRISGGKSTLWLYGQAVSDQIEKLLDDPSFRSEHGWCHDRGTSWMDEHGDDLLVIQGSALAGVFEPL